MTVPDEPRRGQIVADFWIVCGVCEREAPLDTRKRRIGVNKARAWGWARVRDHGWVCPDCWEETSLGAVDDAAVDDR